jgi:hypothetical protein
MKAPDVILASRSAARSAVLRGAGVPFEPAESGLDEDILKTRMLSEGAGPAAIASALAREKALAVSCLHPGLVIGADQTLDFEGQLHDKPPTLEAAADRLWDMRGHRQGRPSAIEGTGGLQGRQGGQLPGQVSPKAKAHGAHGQGRQQGLLAPPSKHRLGIGQELLHRHLAALAAALRQASGVIGEFQPWGGAGK